MGAVFGSGFGFGHGLPPGWVTQGKRSWLKPFPRSFTELPQSLHTSGSYSGRHANAAR